ncbi:hypothetical protein [Flavobacterium sp. N1719]|uniref:hypothetical protein n=1 Tax=Flavobacterium sp. N1719 TaxID=2885633 RepID=UPI002221D322|nr:hypothetical protein [Flavobacterium sp. N1719]
MTLNFTENSFLTKMLYTLCVLVLLLNSYETTFVVWGFTAFITLRKKYSVTFLRLQLLLGLVILVALFSAQFTAHKSYVYFKDISYLLKPMLGLAVGYNICKINGKRFFSTALYAGVLLAIIHILTILVCFFIFKITTMHLLRHYGGYFNDYEIYTLVLLIFPKEFQIKINPKTRFIFIVLLSISAFLYLARTNMIQFVVLIMAIKGYFILNAKNIKYLISFSAIVLAAYAAIYYSNPSRKGEGLEAFLYKIKIAPIESFKTKINEEDWKDFNDNYRSFENIITVRQVTDRGFPTILIGKGMGSTIDLGREMWTNDQEFIRYVPELHNTYMTMYLKAGLIGVFLTVLFMVFLGKMKVTSDPLVYHLNLLLLGSAIFLIVSNWVFLGLYLKLDNKSILLGFLIAYRELIMASKTSPISVKNEY